MKPARKLFFLVAMFVALAANAHAQSLREQLLQMVQQLQKTPTDIVLRERIIKLGAEVKPSPAVPEEARRHFVRGSAIKQSAKDARQQMLAVEAFQEALKIAPWWGDAYYNQGIAQELAGKFDDAEKSFKLSILANPGGKDARDAQDHIYALEGKKQLAESEKERLLEKERLRPTVEGKWSYSGPYSSRIGLQIVRNGERFELSSVSTNGEPYLFESVAVDRQHIRFRVFWSRGSRCISGCDGNFLALTLSPNGNELTGTMDGRDYSPFTRAP